MTTMEAIESRHSVRQYKNIPLDESVIEKVKDEIKNCNDESGLNIQLVTNEPRAFDGMMAHYGNFSGVTSYIALVGKNSNTLEEQCGYYGERIVLKAQQLGLNTCWVALTFKKVPEAFKVNKGEKLTVVIAIGYGQTSGAKHKSKSANIVSKAEGDAPSWFYDGVKAAMLAPTAMNQQKFMLSYKNGKVKAKAKIGFYSKVDLGIVRYHFECGSGKGNSVWI